MATTSEPASRRDFLYIATGAMSVVGAAAAAWPLIAQMEPDASTLAMSTIEVDIGSIAVGGIANVKWRGQPVFIRHLTPKEIETETAVPLATFRDKESAFNERTKKPEWLVAVGVCTHLGCIPLAHEGKYDGWFCPCHGSDYDALGRIRSGPAPKNLVIPEYVFLTDTKLKIG